MRSAHVGGRDTVRTRVDTPLGAFVVEASERGVCSVTPARAETPLPAASADPRSGHTNATDLPSAEVAWAHARAAAEALRRYTEGDRTRFEGPLDVTATAFHQAVWERLRAIPYGTTTRYGRIAADLGMAGEAQAVGAAVGANRIAILVPCHRVVGADGSLRGFAWGLDLKRQLLAHEGSGALALFT